MIKSMDVHICYITTLERKGKAKEAAISRRIISLNYRRIGCYSYFSSDAYLYIYLIITTKVFII